MNIVAITQARTGSTRLANKIMMKINGDSLLKIHINRIKKSKKINSIIIATTTSKNDDIIIQEAENLNVKYYRGSELDVLDRFYNSVNKLKPDYIVRLTSDCPLIDWNLIDLIIEEALSGNYDYCSNTLEDSFPDGQDVEVFKFDSLSKAWMKAKLQSEREHVTPFMKKNSDYFGKNLFKAKNIFSKDIRFKDVRITVDEPDDFKVINLLINKLGIYDSWQNYAELYLDDDAIHNINNSIVRNEGYIKSVNNDTKK